MKDIMFEDVDLDNSVITDIFAVETSYDYFRVECTIDGIDYRIIDTRNSRCSDMVFIDSSHSKGHARWLMEKLGATEFNFHYKFNHNPSDWEEDIGEFDGYYGDGLDHIEELWYMD